jgi:predicted permease
VVVQVALALVLLVGSGLMIRTFQALHSIHPGFTDPGSIQLLRITIPDAQVKEPERVARMQNDILDKLAAIPGVTGVALGTSAPMEGFNSNDVLFAQDKTYGVGEIPPIRRYRSVSPGYFAVTGTPLIAGRDFTWNDLYQKRGVAIISDNMAREMWGSPAAALGKRIREGGADPWEEIIGVVGDVYDNGSHEKPPTIVYWPSMMDQLYGEKPRVIRSAAFLIRSNRAGTESFLTEVRKAVWSVNANVPLALVRTLQDVYEQSMARTSFTLVMLAIAGAMALLLGIVGIYGVISYSVTQRAREIGIRMALGAEQGDLKRMFVRHGLVLAAIGVPCGLAGAFGLARLMSSLLFQISPLDPATYAAVSGMLVIAAMVSSYVPARRVSAVDPVEALRSE